MAEGKKGFNKFVNWLIDSIYKTKDKEPQRRILTEEDFFAAGVSYYNSNINKLACPNPDWKKRASTIVKEGKAGKRIFRYNYVNRPVKLIEEPNNPNDPNAVAVMFAGEIVGYISRMDNVKVKNILANREIISLSGFISGGDYKVVLEDGSVEKDNNHFKVTVRIKYI